MSWPFIFRDIDNVPTLRNQKKIYTFENKYIFDVYIPLFVALQNISLERLIEVVEGLKTNTKLEILEMASVKMTDKVAKVSFLYENDR